ncbi:MAG TPA: hypothetical protein VEJ00_07485 [Candidatus Acidoferrales bacterium]|jgi:hypothetical protein|nr:hypothetical protein [Candidatus Acidoferrales bacterium]
MGSLRTFAEAFGIFAVSIIVLFVLYMVTEKRATGIGVAHWKGYVLMYVGALYFVLGVILTRLK